MDKLFVTALSNYFEKNNSTSKSKPMCNLFQKPKSSLQKILEKYQSK